MKEWINGACNCWASPVATNLGTDQILLLFNTFHIALDQILLEPRIDRYIWRGQFGVNRLARGGGVGSGKRACFNFSRALYKSKWLENGCVGFETCHFLCEAKLLPSGKGGRNFSALHCVFFGSCQYAVLIAQACSSTIMFPKKSALSPSNPTHNVYISPIHLYPSAPPKK